MTAANGQDKELNMGGMKEHPRYNVVSMRISDEEKADLESVTRQTRRSISSIMRDALRLYRAIERKANGPDILD